MSVLRPVTRILAGFHKCRPDVQSVNISLSCSRALDQKWRKITGLPSNPNKERVLLDLPDYSFLDNRPTPYGSRQKLRIQKQMEYTAKIVQLTSEIDFAVKRYQEKQNEKDKNVKSILGRKLRPKGDKLLSEKH